MTNEQRKALRAVPGRVYAAETFGTVDGPGVRYVLFLQGCPLRCLYCHNPDSIDPTGGRPATAGEAVDEILRYKSFIQSGGVTFSGGEPLLQPAFVAAAAALLREQGLHIAIDTAGLPPQGGVEAALEAADLLLLDVKAEDDAAATRLTGRDSTYAWQTLAWCEAHGKPVWVRHVLVEGYTLDDAALHKLAQRLAPYTCIKRVELLPFHKLGEPKWNKTPFTYKLGNTPATTKQQAEAAREIFRGYGLQVQ